jgi:hypothetical protein
VAGPAERPRGVASTAGLAYSRRRRDPFNVDALRALAGRDVACFIVEPVMENIGIVLPLDGYLDAVREITSRHGTLLLFDEVKTGITASWHGAANRYGVVPDLIAIGKSIGGGLPLGAFGGSMECMDAIATGKVLRRHLQRNPLHEAAQPCRGHLYACRDRARDRAKPPLRGRLRALRAARGMPAHAFLRSQGCITWSRTPVRNYRDYLATDFDGVRTMDLGVNRGAPPAPGLDEQWLLSVAHTETDIARVDVLMFLTRLRIRRVEELYGWRYFSANSPIVVIGLTWMSRSRLPPLGLEDDWGRRDEGGQVGVYPPRSVQPRDDFPVDDVDGVAMNATSSTVFHSPVGFSLSAVSRSVPTSRGTREVNHSPAGS